MRDKDGMSLLAHIAETRTELVAEFGGATAYLRATASGAWINDEGVIERDEVVMVEVVVDAVDQKWWATYATLLAERFRQDVVHVRATSIQIISGA